MSMWLLLNGQYTVESDPELRIYSDMTWEIVPSGWQEHKDWDWNAPLADTPAFHEEDAPLAKRVCNLISNNANHFTPDIVLALCKFVSEKE
jgi:hypothetical protein